MLSKPTSSLPQPNRMGTGQNHPTIESPTIITHYRNRSYHPEQKNHERPPGPGGRRLRAYRARHRVRPGVAVDVRVLAQLLQAALYGVVGEGRAHRAALIVAEGVGQRVGQLRVAGGVVDERAVQLAMVVQAALQSAERDGLAALVVFAASELRRDGRGEGGGEASILVQDEGGLKQLQEHGLARVAVLTAEGGQDLVHGTSGVCAVDGAEIDGAEGALQGSLEVGEGAAAHLTLEYGQNAASQKRRILLDSVQASGQQTHRVGRVLRCLAGEEVHLLGAVSDGLALLADKEQDDLAEGRFALRRQRVHSHVLPLVDFVDPYTLRLASALRACQEKTVFFVLLVLGLFELDTVSHVLGVIELGSLVIKCSCEVANMLLQALDFLQGLVGFRGQLGRGGGAFGLVSLELRLDVDPVLVFLVNNARLDGLDGRLGSVEGLKRYGRHVEQSSHE
ncbi:hypothetical protein PG991_006258 [Apiospora marii]|uniref:Uncharacterized protein n=1 Tax=Apiospora marii TaxID=335849 RepID=A0ABR1SDU9_9PEZI